MTRALFDAAVAWWEMKRPVSYSPEQHMDEPEINVTGDASKALARSVVAALRAAPTPPADPPGLVALVQRLQQAHVRVETVPDGDFAGADIADREFSDAEEDLLAWTPAATPETPVEPPTIDVEQFLSAWCGRCGSNDCYGACEPVEPPTRPEAEPNGGPLMRDGDERLMLNAYGRQCHAAGFARGYERKAAELATRPETLTPRWDCHNERSSEDGEWVLYEDHAAALAAETARADREAAARQEAERISAGRLDQLLREADESIQAWIRAENAEAERDRLRAELAALWG